MKNKKGFTLIEILVVVAIIALVGTMAGVAVSSARSKQRDAIRLANIRQVQSALEDYFNENNSYPQGEREPLGDASVTGCLGVSGFSSDCSSDILTIMRRVPATYDGGLSGMVTCGQPARNAFCYTSIGERDSYVVHFELENGLPGVGLQRGVNCATPEGMQAGVCAE